MSIDFFNNQFSRTEKNAEPLNAEPVGLKERCDLIASILNAKMENEGLAEYQRILDNEFLAFSNEVEFKEQAVALHTLQELGNELQLVASYPSLFQKSMVAVGGGFSVGKSSFLNYLLGLNLKLPEAINPTTAIPTYCFKDKREALMGCSQNGGMMGAWWSCPISLLTISF
ncbi:hypothetical protein ID0476_02500 [Helicobacter pylori]